jgi:dephospho-CoA kinase
MIIGITGTNGAGKGTVVEYLVAKGYAHYSVRTELIKEIEKRGMPLDRASMRLVANDLREKNGPEYFNVLFLADAKARGVKNFVIESIRNLGEVKYLKENGAIILAVDADRPIRYERILRRGSDTDKVDFDTWVKQEEIEWHNTAAHDMNVPAGMALADYTLSNNGTLEDLHRQIDDVLAKIG